MTAILTEMRNAFHRDLIKTGTLTLNDRGIPSNADKSQKSSIIFASGIARRIGVTNRLAKLSGQTSGGNFEKSVCSFLESSFRLFNHLRPGYWSVRNLGSSRHNYALAELEPYVHLDYLARAVSENPELRSVLGNGYLISPDVIVSRQPELDVVINNGKPLVDTAVACRTILRAENNPKMILHAVVSCKWTLRSDRAQNARSEALNLVRNRKGRLPHVVVVTGEPSPSRLASLALGTGDIDMVYHFALPELIESVESTEQDEAAALLKTMVDGSRLRDIADLPLDLSV